jgi:threonine dehydrogenase-like Zn-dependent dehydrogenase
MIAAAVGARVVAIDSAAQQLALARKLGAEAVRNATATPDVPAAIRELTGRGAHLSLDALGSAPTCFRFDAPAQNSPKLRHLSPPARFVTFTHVRSPIRVV